MLGNVSVLNILSTAIGRLILSRYAIIALAFYIYPDNVQGEPTGSMVKRFFTN